MTFRNSNFSDFTEEDFLPMWHKVDSPKEDSNQSLPLENREDIVELEITEEFQHALDLMENSDKNIFLTGRPGTGKTELVKHFRRTTEKQGIYLAPTGVAAVNMDGQTIHSFFQIDPDLQINSNNESFITARKRRLLEMADFILIDEISMVRADLLDAINHSLHFYLHHRNEPFAGKQMIFVGDLYQLPPVIERDKVKRKEFEKRYETEYFFSSHAYLKSEFETVELTKVFRQEDNNFKILLDKIRKNEVQRKDLKDLNLRIDSNPPEGMITLCTTNNLVNTINDENLVQLPGKEIPYLAHFSGDFRVSDFLGEEKLIIKSGAQVMMLKNKRVYSSEFEDLELHWANGSLGIVADCLENEIVVDIYNKDGSITRRSVNREKWSKYKFVYSEEQEKIIKEETGSCFQFPCKLAWALTIHKSQGQTLDRVAIDIGSGAFAYGQTYVALSRCRSLEGIYLKRELSHKDFMVDERVVRFMKGLPPTVDPNRVEDIFNFLIESHIVQALGPNYDPENIPESVLDDEVMIKLHRYAEDLCSKFIIR